MTPHWAHPEFAPVLALAVAALAAATVASWWRARRRARRLLGATDVVPARRLAADLVVVAALAAIAAALLGPHAGTRLVRMAGSGVDVVLLFDVSKSMDAADVPPSRLVRARDAARALLARLGAEDRAALAVFAGRGVLLAPLTPDVDALGELVDAVDGELVQPGGSDLAAGVEAAVAAFDPASERPRVVLALADGEDPDGLGDPGTAHARRARARVVAVAFGSDTGAAVPAGDVALLDARGRPVVSRRDTARLAGLAAATDGVALAADRWGDVDGAALAAAVRRDAGSAGEPTLRRVPASLAVPLAAAAFALLALEWTGGARALAALRGRRRAAAVAAALAALALGGAALAASGDAIAWLEAELRQRPGDPDLLVALGLARAERGQPEEAAHAFRAAAAGARERDAAALAYYDLGVAELARGRHEAARDAFLDALGLAPDDEEARFNLQWALRALAAQPPPRAGAGDDEKSDARPDPAQPDSEKPPGGEGEAPPRDAQPAPEPDPAAAQRFAPELSPDRVEKWLGAVDDDPGRALRDAARGEGRRRPSAARSRW